MTRIIRRVYQVVFFVAATPLIWRAGWRLWRHQRLPIARLSELMRDVPLLTSRPLRHPRYLAATAERWLRLLPPRRFGRCLKRSLLLLDLWQRCGLEPVFHLGTAGHGTDRDFHAWVSTSDPTLASPAGRHEEIWTK